MDDWISVEDRLPEDDNFVLVVISGKHRNITYIKALELASYTADEGWIVELCPCWTNPGITHWMPLPEPPKEENNGL